MIGRRPVSVLFRRAADPHNLAALFRMFTVHDRPVRILMEEVFSLGTYPRTLALRSPTGKVEATLYSPADLSTLNLIFCRKDYYAPRDLRTVVDIGSNVGLSALYWLTRDASARVYCYEPSPVSFARLQRNLAAFAGRVALHPAAVSDFSGNARLGLEATGVYSSLDLAAPESVECRVVHVNEALEAALERHGTVDVLKVDSEGHELRTLRSIAPEFWKRIRCVNVDAPEAIAAIPPDFRHSHVASAERFWREDTVAHPPSGR